MSLPGWRPAPDGRHAADAQTGTHPGAPHGLADTHKEKFNADFPAFAMS